MKAITSKRKVLVGALLVLVLMLGLGYVALARSGGTVTVKFMHGDDPLEGGSLTLTAPETIDGHNFLRWRVNGTDKPEGQRQITIDMATGGAAEAMYNPDDTAIRVTVCVVDSEGNNITPASGNIYYKLGSTILYFANDVDANGRRYQDFPAGTTNLEVWVVHNNTTSVHQTQDISQNPNFKFHTRKLTLRLETCGHTPLDGGRARYGVGSTYTTWWFPGGNTGSSAAGETSAEVFPGGTYSFQMLYEGTADEKMDVTIPDSDSTLVWQTTNVTLCWGGSISYGGSTGDARWFKKPSMELLPGTYKFHFRGGPRVDLTFSGCTYHGGVLTLLDHNGKGLAGGKAKWADGSWHDIPGQTDANGHLPFSVSNPNYKKIRMTYNQGSVDQNRAQLAASNYTWQTEQLRIWLHDHNGNPITDQGGRVDQGGGYWYHHGYTNDQGYLDVELFARSAPYKFRMTYNYTSQTKYPTVPVGGGSVVFKTQLAVVTLRVNCTNNMIDGAKVSYAAGSWRNFGTTGDAGPGTGKVTKELFPGNRKIRLTYNYRTNTITHDLTTDFDFVAVPLTIFGFNSAKYAGGSWRTFTLPTMNLLPGTYKFRLDGATHYITVDAANCAQTYGCLTLLDQNGNGVPGGKAKPAYGGSWGSTLSGQTGNDGKLCTTELAPGFTKIRMSINNGSQDQTLAQLQASKYTWYTVPAVIELRDDQNNLITDSPGGGKVDQGGPKWISHGYTGDALPYGKVTVQVFGGGNYKWRMGYNHTSQTKWQVIPSPAGGTVTFRTGKVTVTCGGTIQIALGGSWYPYASGTVLQLLPGTYNYKGACGTGTVTVTAGGQATIP